MSEILITRVNNTAKSPVVKYLSDIDRKWRILLYKVQLSLSSGSLIIYIAADVKLYVAKSYPYTAVGIYEDYHKFLKFLLSVKEIDQSSYLQILLWATSKHD